MMNFQPQPVRLRFTVDEYYQMIELGLLKDYEKAEIIEGELIQNKDNRRPPRCRSKFVKQIFYQKCFRRYFSECSKSCSFIQL